MQYQQLQTAKKFPTSSSSTTGSITAKPLRPSNVSSLKPSPRTQNISTQMNSALWFSCYDGNLSEVQTILQQGCCEVNQTNQKGQSPFWIASFKGRLKIVQFLASLSEIRPITESFFKVVHDEVHYCDVNKTCKEVGKTPLYVACEMNHYCVIKYLLEETEANINTPTKQEESPLFIACYNGFENIVQLLLKHGALVNQHGPNKKRTPLNMACYLGKVNIVQILLEHPYIDTYIKDLFQCDAMDSAIDNSHDQIVDLLKTSRLNHPTGEEDYKKQGEQNQHETDQYNENNDHEADGKLDGEQNIFEPEEVPSQTTTDNQQNKRTTLQKCSTPKTILEEFRGVFNIKVLTAYRNLFAEYDIDNSGQIDGHELQALLEAAGKKVNALEIGKLIQQVDSVENGGNGDGVVSEREFLTMLRDNRKRAHRAADRRQTMKEKKIKHINDKFELDKDKQRRKNQQLESEAERLRIKNEQKMKQKREWEAAEKLKIQDQKSLLEKEWAKPRFAVGGVKIYDTNNNNDD